jgi:hypothetical protein
MVGLTLVRAGLEGDWSGRSLLLGGAGTGPPAVELETAFAATGRFGEVFSNLRAGYVALKGAADGELSRSLGRDLVSLFFGTRCVMNSVETRLKLNTLRNGPEIHVPPDFRREADGRLGSARTLSFRGRPRDKVNNTYGGSVPQR